MCHRAMVDRPADAALSSRSHEEEGVDDAQCRVAGGPEFAWYPDNVE